MFLGGTSIKLHGNIQDILVGEAISEQSNSYSVYNLMGRAVGDIAAMCRITRLGQALNAHLSANPAITVMRESISASHGAGGTKRPDASGKLDVDAVAIDLAHGKVVLGEAEIAVQGEQTDAVDTRGAGAKGRPTALSDSATLSASGGLKVGVVPKVIPAHPVTGEVRVVGREKQW